MNQIRQIGTALGPDVLAAVQKLYDAEQSALAAQVPVAATDLPYGPDARHRIDFYGRPAHSAPILLFVHGGGFRIGDKAAGGWPNAAVGRWAAQQGWLGAVMNYRLAPAHTWPAGAEDVLAAIDWLTERAVEHGGDPAKIVLAGTSAGAVHIATALKLRPGLAARGCVLLSGLYGYAPRDPRDTLYYGDPALYPRQTPREAVAATNIPLFIACAEYDPPRFQAEFLGLMQERLERDGAMPPGYIASDHNHYSLAMHIGTSDRRLGDAIVGFVKHRLGL